MLSVEPEISEKTSWDKSRVLVSPLFDMIRLNDFMLVIWAYVTWSIPQIKDCIIRQENSAAKDHEEDNCLSTLAEKIQAGWEFSLEPLSLKNQGNLK